ncbi:MAG: GAF domain-containing sensor histidine kinase [bacterium]
MVELTALAATSAALALGAFWYLKFSRVLPLEKALMLKEKESVRLADFAGQLSETLRVPDSRDYLLDISQQALARFHKLFPGCILWLFEKEAVAGGWKLISQAGTGSRTGTVTSRNIYASGLLDTGMLSGEMRLMALSQDDKDSVAASLTVCGMRTAMIIPCMRERDTCGRILVLAGSSDANLEQAGPYLDILSRHIIHLHMMAREILHLRKDASRLIEELDAAMQELNSAGTRLIQRARERKALYEVVSTITSNPYSPQSASSSVLAILAKIMEADVAACLLFDDEKKALVTQTGAYGVGKDTTLCYSVPLTNTKSSSVRTFLSRKPFMTGDAQSDSEVISHYAKLWNIHSLMVVAIVLHDKTIGIIRVGSAKINFFTQDQLEFLCLIAEELSVIIEAINLYDKLASAADELAQLNRLKDEFVSTVSHELKTPLTAIRGFISVLLSGDAGAISDQQRKFLSIADQAVTRLNHLISDLLDLSRLDGKVVMEFKPVSIGKLLERAVESFTFQAQEKNIHLSLELNAPLPGVNGDARWIEQVIDNLVSNSVKFTSQDGRIILSCESKGDIVVVCVSDTGPGIKPEEQEQIFYKFYRGSNNSGTQPGTGLGLAISKSIIERHGGKIWVKSVQGEGAKFYFALPVAARVKR